MNTWMFETRRRQYNFVGPYYVGIPPFIVTISRNIVCSKTEQAYKMYIRSQTTLAADLHIQYIYSIYTVHIQYASAHTPYFFKLPTTERVYNINTLFGGLY